MKHFFSLVFLCLALLLSSAFVAVRIGHGQPEVTFITELQPCGDSLCYLGILPGTTPWNEALTVIRQAPKLKVADNSDTLFLSANPHYKIGVLPLEINFGEIEDKISAGNVIVRLGQPCYVFPIPGDLILGWPNVLFSVSTGDHTVSAHSRVDHIVLRRRFDCTDVGQTVATTVYKWRGFGRYP